MLRKSIASVVMALSAMVCFIGCSNQNSPVSVSEDLNQSVAALSDVALWQIASAGSSVWGMSKERPAGDVANWCIYQYNTSTQLWTKSTHFGMDIATSPSGRCYHTNNGLGSGIHQLWWGTMNSNGQIQIPAGMTTIMDIAAGRVGMEDYVWAIFGNGTSTYYVYVNKTVNGVKQWVNMTKDLNNYDDYCHRIAVDPYNGNLVMLKKNNRKCYVLTSENGSWKLQNTPSGTVEVAIRGTKAAYLTETHRIYTGTVNGSYNATPVMYNAIETISMDGSYIYYINTSYKANRITY